MIELQLKELNNEYRTNKNKIVKNTKRDRKDKFLKAQTEAIIGDSKRILKKDVNLPVMKREVVDETAREATRAKFRAMFKGE